MYNSAKMCCPNCGMDDWIIFFNDLECHNCHYNLNFDQVAADPGEYSNYQFEFEPPQQMREMCGGIA